MNQLKFGDYISVEQKRFGVANEHYTHKVIRTLQSNSWTAVPVHVGEKSSLHESTEDVVECICCGLDESKVVRYRIEDVKFMRSDAHDKELEISAYQLSQDNIINGLGITGDGPVSKSVIEYVLGLVAENVALKAALSPQDIPDEALEAFGDTAEFDHDSCEAGSWSWVKNDSEVILAVFKAMPKPETPNTDAFTAELRAQGVDEFTTDLGVKAAMLSTSSNVYKVLKSIIFSSVDFAANLRAGRKG